MSSIDCWILAMYFWIEKYHRLMGSATLPLYADFVAAMNHEVSGELSSKETVYQEDHHIYWIDLVLRELCGLRTLIR